MVTSISFTCLHAEKRRKNFQATPQHKHSWVKRIPSSVNGMRREWRQAQIDRYFFESFRQSTTDLPEFAPMVALSCSLVPMGTACSTGDSAPLPPPPPPPTPAPDSRKRATSYSSFPGDSSTTPDIRAAGGLESLARRKRAELSSFKKYVT